VLGKKVAHLEEYESRLARALAELDAAKAQIDKLNTAMDYLLSKPPHNGRYFDKVSRALWQACIFPSEGTLC
jgi:hypothetical protein